MTPLLKTRWLGMLSLGLPLGCATVLDIDDPRDPPAPAEPTPIFAADGRPAATQDPTTCAQAAASKSYVGCDFYPTVLANTVDSVFDFAVAVANVGKEAATLSVSGPGIDATKVTVDAGEVRIVKLPWVRSLKGLDADACGNGQAQNLNVVAKGGAYHLQSSSPVVVYQFNALQYAPDESKSFAACAGYRVCATSHVPIGCFSFSNDATLLFPATAVSANYRVAGLDGGLLSFTALADDTRISLRLPPGASVAGSADGTVAKTAAGRVLSLRLEKAGDVAQVDVEGTAASFSGALATGNRPFQIISGHACAEVPTGVPACDHTEEQLPPAESLGSSYLLAAPTGPLGNPVARWVRLVGNVDGTDLEYAPSRPAGCPAHLDAGEVGNCGLVEGNLAIKGSHELLVVSSLLGASVVDAFGGAGDPSLYTHASLEQFRTRYVFLAPKGYDAQFADILTERDTELLLDGRKLSTANLEPTSGSYGVLRVRLEAGVHELSGNHPIGLGVDGYGAYTSYAYPGGLDARFIAPPPSVK